jgi:hypothetical protein
LILFKSIINLSKLFFYLIFFKRILFSPEFGADLILVVEPLDFLGAISINETTDIYYHVSQAEVTNVLKCANEFYTFWEMNLQDEFGTIESRLLSVEDASLKLKTSAFHTVGTTAMTTRGSEGAINADLSTFSNSNIFVISTSVLPRSGSGNPTMTTLALGLLAVEKIGNYFKQTNI